MEKLIQKLDKLQTEIDNLRNELGKYNEQLMEQLTEQKYPIYCKFRTSSMVVKFTGLREGMVVVKPIYTDTENYLDNWIKHTDTLHWQQLEVCPETGFFDGQAVWCWDNGWVLGRVLGFYNVKNKCIYPEFWENLDSRCEYKNLEPFEGNYTEWMLKAFETLER